MWKQADVQDIQDNIAFFVSAFSEDNQDSVEDMWSSFKDIIHTIIDERVPSKLTQARQTHPWMNRRTRGEDKTKTVGIQKFKKDWQEERQ